MNSEQYYDNIRNKLLRLTTSSKMGRNALAFSVQAEFFFKDFFNVLFEWDLR